MFISDTHEWITIEGKVGTVGISTDAAAHIGNVVFVELPRKGSSIQAGHVACVLESSKSASDVYSPVSGTICAVNKNVAHNPSLINLSPEKEGWLFQIELSEPKELQSLFPKEEE